MGLWNIPKPHLCFAIAIKEDTVKTGKDAIKQPCLF